MEAIRDHKSRGSEANTVIERFNRLTTQEQQEVIDFLLRCSEKSTLNPIAKLGPQTPALVRLPELANPLDFAFSHRIYLR